MAKIRVGYSLTLNLGNFNNFKPEIMYELDTDFDLGMQLAACRDATKKALNVVSEEMEDVLEREDVKNFETTVENVKKAIVALEQRIDVVEDGQYSTQEMIYDVREQILDEVGG